MAAGTSTSSTSPSAEGLGKGDRQLFFLSLMLFFVWGFATVLLDILVPKFRGLFELSFAEAMLTQFAFFLGYFIFSLPAGYLVARLGYMRGIVAGLVVMATGCLLFLPATQVGVYAMFLFALFVMAAGITILQVAANAVIAISGPAAKSSARLTLAQAFNSFGTFLGPYVGAKLILERGPTIPTDLSSVSPAALAALRAEEAAVLQLPYLGIAAILIVMTVIFIAKRDLIPRDVTHEAPQGLGLDLLSDKRVLFGVLAIFFYVGAEVSIGSLLVNYLSQSNVLGTTEAAAGKLVALYWGGAMIGRFAGSAILSRVSPGKTLAAFAIGAAALTAVSALSTGTAAAVLILAVGLFNSIMFPTIFSQSIIGLGGRASQGAALLCMGIVGGAILPVLTGFVADRHGLAASLIVPILGYGWLVFFGMFVARRPVAEVAA